MPAVRACTSVVTWATRKRPTFRSTCPAAFGWWHSAHGVGRVIRMENLWEATGVRQGEEGSSNMGTRKTLAYRRGRRRAAIQSMGSVLLVLFGGAVSGPRGTLAAGGLAMAAETQAVRV